jgi:phosphatidate cytidylyltransferase
MITTPSPSLLWMLHALAVSMVLGSIARWFSLRHATPTLRHQRLASLRTWWILAIVAGIAILAGRLGICLLLLVASVVAFREYASLLGLQNRERPALFAAYAIAVVNYLLILFEQTTAFVLFVPLVSLAVIALVQILQGKATGYIRITGGLFWGMMVIFYGMAHAAYLFIDPTFAHGPAGPAGWLLYLLILTEGNDIFQALVGRSPIAAHQRHRIAPTLSPKKTWEGFVGGLIGTLILALCLAPWLTSLQAITAPVLTGLVVAVAGFFGDLNMSGIKRDSGVKDGSHLLPGMGGLVDRIDSLTFTAPAFVYLLGWLLS